MICILCKKKITITIFQKHNARELSILNITLFSYFSYNSTLAFEDVDVVCNLQDELDQVSHTFLYCNNEQKLRYPVYLFGLMRKDIVFS